MLNTTISLRSCLLVFHNLHKNFVIWVKPSFGVLFRDKYACRGALYPPRGTLYRSFCKNFFFLLLVLKLLICFVLGLKFGQFTL